MQSILYEYVKLIALIESIFYIKLIVIIQLVFQTKQMVCLGFSWYFYTVV